jgi:hypothetical protein
MPKAAEPAQRRFTVEEVSRAVLKGNAIPIPPDPPRDSRGRRLEIVR